MLAAIIENRLFVGTQLDETAQLTRTATAADIDRCAAACGDFNPSHVDRTYAKERRMNRRVAYFRRQPGAQPS